MNQQYLPPPLNILKSKDIHTRKELWRQKIKLLDLKKFDKDFWNSSYDFLPLPKTYTRIQKKIKEWIDKNKDRETQFLECQKKLGEILIEIAKGEEEEINFPSAEYEPAAEAEEIDKEAVIKEIKENIRDYLKEYRELLDRNNEKDKQIIKTINFILNKDDLKAYRAGVKSIKKLYPDINIRQLENYVEQWEELVGSKPKIDKPKLKELKKIAIALQKNNWEQIEDLNNNSCKNEEISQLVQQYKEIKDELREPCYITYHENNVLQFTYHNVRGADLEQENYGFLYRNKLYFISNSTYIDNAKLYCRVEAFVDKIYLYYANYIKSPGTIKLNRAPLFLENKENPLAESNKLHYSFCNDKGNLVIEEVKNPDIQPRLKTVVLDVNTEVSSQHLTSFKAGPNKWDPEIITNFTMTDVDTVGGAASYLANWWKSTTMGGQTLAFLAPYEYYANKSVQYVSFSKLDGNKGKPEEIALPSVYNQYPHLIHESVVQVFFLNKLVHTGFLNQFWLEEKGGTNPDGNSTGKYIVLKFLNQVRANPSGIYYLMSSKTQIWKAELAVSQIYKTQNLVQKILSGVAEKWGGFKDILGLNEEVPKEQPENEESTRRKYKNPSKGGNKNKPLITPDLLYANTVDLKYDFLEFANRYCSPALVFRFQYSNDLLNNLHNCNNKSHELSLDLKFNSLGVLINKPGSYQGNLRLRNDATDGFISGVFQKEVFFYEEIEKDLTKPQLKLVTPVNHVVYPISDASIAVGDEKIESQTFTHQIPYQADKREYAHATWFCFSDGEVQESFKSACSCSFTHYYNNAPNTTQTGWCWGCTYDDLSRSNFLATQFTPQKDCQFVYCLEVGATPTSRPLQGGTTYNFTFTSTDILISWTVYKRDTEKVDIPGIDPDDLVETPQPDQEEEIPDLTDLEEDDGENEESSESNSESSESSVSSSESSEESEENDESETDDSEENQEE